jgi:hypothetical protein
MCRDFGDIFSLVKKVVMKSLGEHRVGLMLYLGNLPLNVGAFHPLESNGIVLNRRLLDKISTDKTSSEWKAFTFSILLHEYLHTLGYIDEREVKGLVYQISAENFGRTHPITKATVSGPWVNLSQEDFMEMRQELDIELVKDFERINHRYIV